MKWKKRGRYAKQTIRVSVPGESLDKCQRHGWDDTSRRERFSDSDDGLGCSTNSCNRTNGGLIVPEKEDGTVRNMLICGGDLDDSEWTKQYNNRSPAFGVTEISDCGTS